MVGREDLINAIALNSTIFNSRPHDRAGGGRAAGRGDRRGLVLLRQRGQLHRRDRGTAADDGPRPGPASPLPGSALASIIEGFRYVERTRPIRALLLLLGLVSLVGMPYAVLMPIFADQILHGGPRALGILMSAIGVGALAGALTLAAKKGIRGLGRWVALSATGFGFSLILFSFSRTFWLSAALLLPVGFSVMVQMASSNTLIQSLVPDSLRGRVMAVYSMMFMGMAPFGSLLAGTLAERLGAPGTVAVGGIVCIAGALVFGLRLPVLRHEARRIIVALQEAGGEPPEEINGQESVVAPLDPNGDKGDR